MGEGDEQGESAKREGEWVGWCVCVCVCVCVPVPEISLMAAVSFYLMEGRRRAGERATEKDGQRDEEMTE